MYNEEYENYDEYVEAGTGTGTGMEEEMASETMEQPAPEAPGKKKKTGRKMVAFALCFALLGSALGVGGVAVANARKGSGSTTLFFANRNLNAAVETSYVDTTREMTPKEIYAGNVESTVGITTQITTNYFGYQTQAAASGSGFILTEDGYVLTNYHVIEDASTITVSMFDGTTYDAKLVGYDQSNDIAVLKIDATGLSPVVLGDSSSLSVGDQVMAIGNPLGELTFSLTVGYVSALGRSITLENGTMMNLIQTDAAINSGNSGGALFNTHGEVIGITNAKYSSSGFSGTASIDNIGFAIPVNTVRNIIMSIIENGYIVKPYIGVNVDVVSRNMMRYGIPAGVANTGVMEESPAQAAGIQVDDIVTKVNGQEISTTQELSNAITNGKVGDELVLTIYRKGEYLELTVVIGERQQEALPSQQNQNNQSGNQGQNRGQNGQGNGSDDSMDEFENFTEDFFGSSPFGFYMP